jgi:hypothetical protein
MRNFRKSLILFLAVLTLAVPALAASKSQPEFDQLKSLAGNWEGPATEGKPAHINYQVVSGGSAVMETIQEKSAALMITMYHLDGDQLMMTHYCMANNQPRMRADAATSSPNSIKFKYVDATNLATPDDGHMVGLTIDFKDADHVATHWTWRQKGVETIETFELHRVK